MVPSGHPAIIGAQFPGRSRPVGPPRCDLLLELPEITELFRHFPLRLADVRPASMCIFKRMAITNARKLWSGFRNHAIKSPRHYRDIDSLLQPQRPEICLAERLPPQTRGKTQTNRQWRKLRGSELFTGCGQVCHRVHPKSCN